jgi:hypothetical protein
MRKLITIIAAIAAFTITFAYADEDLDLNYALSLVEPIAREYVEMVLIPKYKDLVRIEVEHPSAGDRPHVVAALKIRVVAMREAEKRYPRDIEKRVEFYEAATYLFDSLDLNQLNELSGRQW